MTLADLKNRYERFTKLETEIRELKSEIALNDAGFAKQQAEALIDGDEKAASMKNPSEKLRVRLAQLESIFPHAEKLIQDAATEARANIDGKMFPLEDAATAEIERARVQLSEITAEFQRKIQAPTDELSRVTALRSELRNAVSVEDILRHVGEICATCNLNLDPPETEKKSDE